MRAYFTTFLFPVWLNNRFRLPRDSNLPKAKWKTLLSLLKNIGFCSRVNHDFEKHTSVITHRILKIENIHVARAVIDAELSEYLI